MDAAGNAHVTGYTSSINFTTTPGGRAASDCAYTATSILIEMTGGDSTIVLASSMEFAVAPPAQTP